jgi:hypothetical protein
MKEFTKKMKKEQKTEMLSEMGKRMEEVNDNVKIKK